MRQNTAKCRRRARSAGDLAGLAYRQLQERLWSGALGPGAKVSETRLAKELGMSRTPVREAIARLEREGVMQQVASSGTFVRRPDRLAIVEAYEVRIAIECFAVQKAALRMKPAEVRALRGHCDRMLAAIREFRDSGARVMGGEPLALYQAADLGFHFMLVEAAANRRALDIFRDVNLLNYIFGCRSHERDLHHVAWVWLGHARVAGAIRRRDPGAAVRALERHMRSSMGAALQAYDERLAGRGRAGDHGAMTASTHCRDSSKIRDVAERPRRLARATRTVGQTLARSATLSPPVGPPSAGMISDPRSNPQGNRSNP
ncbi:MAG: GntR family transcriptional regulator [Verrucomicrobiae bacterium]|nr:GntR family transcriptional regulator [Verrucomicrobiae bacterium]